VHVRSVFSVAVLAGSLVLLCQPAHAAIPEAWQGSTVATGIVEYECTTTGETAKQDIKVNVELTMPADARTGEQMTIGWRGTYADGTGLKAPAAGLAAGTKLYAYASISGLTALTSATGVGVLETAAPGQVIPLPTVMVELKTTARNAGTASVKPAAINFGTLPTTPSIQCDVQNAADLTTYTLTVAAAGTTSPTPTPAPSTTSPKPTHTVTVTETPESANDTVTTAAKGNSKVTRTPVGAAGTGGGGGTGPDGRKFVLTGSLLILAAVTGLFLRRRRAFRT
jgi:hypothetical protein